VQYGRNLVHEIGGWAGLRRRAGPQGVAVFQRAFNQAAAKNDQDRQMTVTETMWSTTPGQRGGQEGVWAAQPSLQRARHRNMPCAPPRPRADELAWPRSEWKGNEKRPTGADAANWGATQHGEASRPHPHAATRTLAVDG
jgi:hypothetical protein